MIQGPRSPHIADAAPPLVEAPRRFASFDEELIARLRELADMLGQDSSLVEGLGIQAAMSERPELRALFRRMLDFEDRGLFFDRALRAAPVKLEPEVCAPLRLGMSVGSANWTLRRLATYLHNRRCLRRRMLEACLQLFLLGALVIALAWGMARILSWGTQAEAWILLCSLPLTGVLALLTRRELSTARRFAVVCFTAGVLADELSSNDVRLRDLVTVLDRWGLDPGIQSPILARLHREVAPEGGDGFPSFGRWLEVTNRGVTLFQLLESIACAGHRDLALERLRDGALTLSILLSSPIGLVVGLVFVGRDFFARRLPRQAKS